MSGRVLVVEDEVLVAMMIENMLDELGYTLVDTAADLKTAVDKAHATEADVALIDVDLAGFFSFPAAVVLGTRNIPFAFTTGHGADVQFPKDMYDAPRLIKPFSYDELKLILTILMCRGGKDG